MQLSFELQSIYAASLANKGTMRYCVSNRGEKKKFRVYRKKSENRFWEDQWFRFNSRNKRRLPSRASFLRSGQVPGLCVQVEQKHFYSTAEFLRRRRSRVKDIQREKERQRQKIDWKIMCCEILNWKQILEYCVGEIELYIEMYIRMTRRIFTFLSSWCIHCASKNIIWMVKKNC